jgi:hypothetical protein
MTVNVRMFIIMFGYLLPTLHTRFGFCQSKFNSNTIMTGGYTKLLIMIRKIILSNKFSLIIYDAKQRNWDVQNRSRVGSITGSNNTGNSRSRPENAETKTTQLKSTRCFLVVGL